MAIYSTRPAKHVREVRASMTIAAAKRGPKPDLQAMLAAAAENTKFDQQLEEFMRVVGPLLKGKRH